MSYAGSFLIETRMGASQIMEFKITATDLSRFYPPVGCTRKWIYKVENSNAISEKIMRQYFKAVWRCAAWWRCSSITHDMDREMEFPGKPKGLTVFEKKKLKELAAFLKQRNKAVF